jgi:outer membrane lipoprotein-sorting protein
LHSMKRKLAILGIITILAIVFLSLIACSSSSTTSQTTTPASTSQTTSASTATSTTPSGQTSGGSVASLLGKAVGITSMKFDLVTTAPDNSVTTSTAWVKKNKMRIEGSIQGQNTVTLIDGDAKTMYVYNPAQNTAIKMDFNLAPQSPSASSISQYNPIIVGSETLDGKLCQILQYTANGVLTKEWVWDAKGLPVRTQMTTSSGISTTDYKNYDFSDIPDSMFVLPAGVQISSGFPINLPSGLPTSLPSGFPTNLPSGLPTNFPTGLPK